MADLTELRERYENATVLDESPPTKTEDLQAVSPEASS